MWSGLMSRESVKLLVGWSGTLLLTLLAACQPGRDDVRRSGTNVRGLEGKEKTNDSATAAGNLAPYCKTMIVDGTGGADVPLVSSPLEGSVKGRLPAGSCVTPRGIEGKHVYVSSSRGDGYVEGTYVACASHGEAGQCEAPPANNPGSHKDPATKPATENVGTDSQAPSQGQADARPNQKCAVKIPFPEWLVPFKTADCRERAGKIHYLKAGTKVTWLEPAPGDPTRIHVELPTGATSCLVERKYLTGCR